MCKCLIFALTQHKAYVAEIYLEVYTIHLPRDTNIALAMSPVQTDLTAMDTEVLFYPCETR